jgi:hypothetical protein
MISTRGHVTGQCGDFKTYSLRGERIVSLAAAARGVGSRSALVVRSHERIPFALTDLIRSFPRKRESRRSLR